MAFKDEKNICFLLYNKWHVVKHLHRILKPLYQATIVMQKSDFTMSDFYASWVQVEEKLNKYVQKSRDAELATLLLHYMSKRKHKLFDNPAMSCALALDPRFCNELDENQKKRSLDALVGLWMRMKVFEMNKNVNNSEAITLEDSDSSSDEDISIENTTVLMAYKNKKDAADEKSNIYSANVSEITSAINTFMIHQHDISEGTIYNFWMQNHKKFPELFAMSQIIYGISPTQAIVERAFSVLSHTFPAKRNQLDGELLDDILTICLNNDLFTLVNKEDMDTIFSKK